MKMIDLSKIDKNSFCPIIKDQCVGSVCVHWRYGVELKRIDHEPKTWFGKLIKASTFPQVDVVKTDKWGTCALSNN
ncbi:hypothetical protein UFOVP787_192 [uncultured Caudovirales phage]|uniref:Uncharacterized protein n=1 Tax=uncultured Caudovirales phage TaxID=2100421 RepID=A0A6J5NVX8_9CAUD|nr:hypothetical protein UFOVP787_192 [uncultured Caudovirales phage]